LSACNPAEGNYDLGALDVRDGQAQSMAHQKIEARPE
jgi:hypothetical protein